MATIVFEKNSLLFWRQGPIRSIPVEQPPQHSDEASSEGHGERLNE